MIRQGRELLFRAEKFYYIAHYYLCCDTNEQFTTTDLDTLNINQVYNQYRVKYGIPFPDEIKATRNLYDLSAAKMSRVLGLGANQYRLYENGEMPSESIGKLLRSIMAPQFFIEMIHNAENQFSPKEYKELINKLNSSINQKQPNLVPPIFRATTRSATNGYAPLSYDRLKNIILYFIKECGGVFSTKMNKLLFYTDFLSYKEQGVGMSGLAYKAIQYGPVPYHWGFVYDSIEEITEEIIAFMSGYSGTMLTSEVEPNLSLFTTKERAVMERVLSKFRQWTANDISEESHLEEAWIRYNKREKLIDYNTAFSLKSL